MIAFQHFLRRRWLIGGGLLLIALSISLLTLFWGVGFSDEGDNLAGGLLLARGYTLYRDVFSHHFPFVYYWSALVASLLGNSIAAARISMLFFQIGLFAWTMYLTRYYVAIGLFSVIWAVVGLFYLGNWMVYSIFSGTALAVIFIISVAILNRRIIAGKKELATLGVLSLVAILTDPLSVYAVGCLLIFLGLSPAKFKGSLVVALFVGTGLGLYAGYLLVSGAANDFYQQAILFNANIYGKYTPTEPLRLAKIPQLAGSLLSIGNFQWVRSFDPFIELDRLEINHWLFAGFLFRLTVVLSAGILLCRRRFLLASFVFSYAVAVLLINQETFRTIPFVMLACSLAAWLIANGLDGDGILQEPQAQNTRIANGLRFMGLKLLPWSARIIIGCGFAWLVLRGVETIVRERDQLSYVTNFRAYEKLTSYIVNDLACGRQDVSLGYYPGEPTLNYLTGFRPVSKYLYLWPWVAEVALPDLLQSLQVGKAIVYIDWEALVWKRYRVADYLAEVKTYLDENYEAVESGFYVSPDLMQECQPTQTFPLANIPAEVPEGELLPGLKYFQTFESKCEGLSFIRFLPATYRRSITSTLKVRMKDLGAGQQLFEATIPGQTIVDNQWSEVTFDPVSDSKGKHYRVTLLSPDASVHNAVGIWRSEKDVYPDGEALINDQPLQADWVFQYGCRQP